MALRSLGARASGVAVLVVWSSVGVIAQAADPAREEHRVDFEAEQVEIAGSESELSLSGDVVVRAERFQLTADAVTLSRSPRGVHVEGSGRLAFCRCKHPPLTLGFAAADLAPPTDVLLEHATVRVFGVPLFYSPYLWLRAPTRPGLTPPTFAYRGEEGILLGAGAHLPLARDGATATVVDLGAGAYLAGGTRLSADVRGPFGRGRMGWDYYQGSALEAAADFASTSDRAATWAASLRMLRGERSRIAPATIEDVALRTDRARLTLGRARSSVVAFSVTGTSPRGSAIDAVPVFGPLLELGGSFPVGSRAVASLLLETEALRTAGGEVSASALSAGLAGNWPIGPVLSEVWVRHRSRALTVESGHALSFDGEVRQRVALPLARRFGAVVHRLEPVVEGAVGTRRTRRGGGAPALEEEPVPERFAVLAGLENAVGWAREAADVRIMGGVSGQDDVRAVIAARARLGIAPITLETEARAAPQDRAVQLFGRAQAGDADVVMAAFHVEARRRNPSAVERLFHDDFTRPEVPWLETTGVSAGGSALFPLGFGLRSELSLDVDVTRERFLGGTGTVGYRHVCDCLGVALWGAKRMGREDFDLALRVDLVP